MISRAAIFTVREMAKIHPFIAVTGPRQSGKSTLIRAAFPDKPLISLEEPDIREVASSSPGDFLDRYPDGAIFDEAQRSPGLLSHILNLTDRDNRKGLYILTGTLPSFFLSEITRAQEVRIGILHLLPLSISELTEVGELPAYIDELLYRGMYPPLYDSPITPSSWYSGYLSNFLDRDLRQLINIRELSLFQCFLRTCAAQIGRILNLSTLARECRISHNTAKSWLSILEASHIVFSTPAAPPQFQQAAGQDAKAIFLRHRLGFVAPGHSGQRPNRLAPTSGGTVRDLGCQRTDEGPI